MTHRFPIKEIALQAGLSTATVDRVLHGRPHVSPQTRARVAAAIEELEGQEQQLAARGRRVFIDFVVEAPQRFSREIRRAVEAELPLLQPAVVRPRFAFHERISASHTAATLRRIARRGSQGVCLKARDRPPVREAMAELSGRGIPVVTVFTDVPGARLAYAGMDNRKAGETAAYLVAQGVRAPGTVLTSRSNDRFLGETERADAFAHALARRRPDLSLLDASGGAGLELPTAEQVSRALRGAGPVRAVYSMGGGNPAILSALARAGQRPDVYVAHDLDRDNVALLRQERISFVLQDDLRRDVRAACQIILAHHRIIRLAHPPEGSDVLIVSPANL